MTQESDFAKNPLLDPTLKTLRCRQMATYQAKPNEQQERWFIVDAKGKNLGRMASQIATLLRGKHKPTFTPHVDGGDSVVVINAEKVAIDRAKQEKILYRYHTQYVGGLVERTAKEMLDQDPEKLIERAVWGMLPSTHLGRKQLKKLKVYRGEAHPHQAQNPVPAELKY